MKSVFEIYKDLWPADRHVALEPLLGKIPVLHYPEDQSKMKSVLPEHVVLVVNQATLAEVVEILQAGFEHVVQKSREDFPQELLASSLMVVRPEAFRKDPLPFFFTGFKTPAGDGAGERNLVVKFHRSDEKPVLLDWLDAFLNEVPQIASIKDLCIQSADEMITNAIFNAPVKPSGTRPYRELPRESEVILPEDKKATLFACFSERRVIIGCSDLYGSLAKDALIAHLRGIFSSQKSTARTGTGGAGLGFKYLIENAANTYVISTKGTSTLVACGFSLKGLKSNLTAAKHFHLSFR